MKLITWITVALTCPLLYAKTLRCINTDSSSSGIGFEMINYQDQAALHARVTVAGELREGDHLNLRFTTSSRFGYQNYEGEVISPVDTAAALWINTKHTGASNRVPGQITFTPGKRIPLVCKILNP